MQKNDNHANTFIIWCFRLQYIWAAGRKPERYLWQMSYLGW